MAARRWSRVLWGPYTQYYRVCGTVRPAPYRVPRTVRYGMWLSYGGETIKARKSDRPGPSCMCDLNTADCTENASPDPSGCLLCEHNRTYIVIGRKRRLLYASRRCSKLCYPAAKIPPFKLQSIRSNGTINGCRGNESNYLAYGGANTPRQKLSSE